MTSRILTVLAAAAFAPSALAAAPANPIAPVILSVMEPGVRPDTEVFPPADTDGMVVAARLAAGQTDFDVRTVSYDLVGASEECDAGLPHLLRVWKSRSFNPAVNMDKSQEYVVPEAMDGGMRRVTIGLQRTIRLAPGENLYVAVHLVRDGEASMCIAAASERPEGNTRQYATSSFAAPAQWTTFEALDADMSMAIRAAGYIAR